MIPDEPPSDMIKDPASSFRVQGFCVYVVLQS